MKLKELRLKNNKSQKQVATDLNIPYPTYNVYEKEQYQPNIETLIKMANYFHTTVDYLIGRENTNIIDKGLLNETELNVIDIMKELNKENQGRVEAYAMALYQTQNDNEKIATRIRRN